MSDVLTRMGDGYSVEMSLEEIREDIVAGSADAAAQGQDPRARAG